MIRETPAGWTDTGLMKPTGRCYTEDASDVAACYLPIFTPGKPGPRWPRRLTLGAPGAITDDDRDRALVAFDMEGATEDDAAPGCRAFLSAGSA